jgi:hypothetical protein
MVNRRQASLYLTNVPHIESLRRRFDPTQARLIPTHVTLCREDEVKDWDAFRARLQSLCPFEISLEFGDPVREDNFVFLPVREGFNDFHAFRRALLTDEPRIHIPHVTIIHPRNGTCTDQIFTEISESIPPLQFTFREVMLVEQEDGDVWKLIARVGTANGLSSAENPTNKAMHPSRGSSVA